MKSPRERVAAYYAVRLTSMPLSPGEPYRLEKSVWSQADFESMGWHDVVVHSIAFDTEHHRLLLDIDYIFAWVDPLPPSPSFSFWLSPSTLVFDGAWDLKIEYDASLGFQLQEIERSEPRLRPHGDLARKTEEWRWTLEGNEGAISFWASWYRQFTRRSPTHHTQQSLRLDERGGISFDTPEAPDP